MPSSFSGAGYKESLGLDFSAFFKGQKKEALRQKRGERFLSLKKGGI